MHMSDNWENMHVHTPYKKCALHIPHLVASRIKWSTAHQGSFALGFHSNDRTPNAGLQTKLRGKKKPTSGKTTQVTSASGLSNSCRGRIFNFVIRNRTWRHQHRRALFFGSLFGELTIRSFPNIHFWCHFEVLLRKQCHQGSSSVHFEICRRQFNY